MIAKILHKFYIDGFILALFVMVLLGVLIPTSGQAADILRLATQIAIGLMFLLHGIRLPSEQVLAGLRHWRLHLVLLTITFGIYPVLGLCIDRFTGHLLSGALGIGLVYVTLVPSTIQACVAYTAIARGNVAAAVVAAGALNLLGVVITPMLVAATLGTGGGAQVDLNSFVRTTTQLLVPFVAGQLIRPHVKGLVQRYAAQLNRYDRVLILVVVFSAFSAGTAAGIWTSVPLSQFAIAFVLCVGLLVIGLAITMTAGRRLGFRRDDRIVIIFVGSSKALGAGLAMAAVLFPGDQTALIIVPLMFYHQMNLIVQAFIAQRLSRRAPDEVADGPVPSAPSPACDELLHRLGVQLPASGDGFFTRIASGVEESPRIAREPADVLAWEEPDGHPRAPYYLATRIEMVATGTIGAVVADADARPAVERFATSARTSADHHRLINDLRLAGIPDGGPDCDEALAALLAAAGEHPIRVVGCDTRVGRAAGALDTAESLRRRLQPADSDTAAVVSRMLATLPAGKKLVALVGTVQGNSVGAVDDDRSAVSIAQRNGNLHAGIEFHPGDAIYYPRRLCAADTFVNDNSTLVRQRPAGEANRLATLSVTVVLTATMGFALLQMFLIGAMGPRIVPDLGMSAAMLGLTTSAGFGLAAVLSPMAGRAVDLLGARRCLVVLLVLVACALGLIALAPTYSVLLVAVAIGGLPQALANPATNKAIRDFVPLPRRATVTGVKQSGVQLGALAAGLPLTLVASYAGWRAAAGVAAATAVVFALWTWRTLPADPPRPARGPITALPTAQPARSTATVRWLTMYALFTGAAMGSVNLYLALFGERRLGMSETMAGTLLAVVGVTGVVGRIGWAGAAGRPGLAVPMTAGLATASAGTALLLVAAPWVPALAWAAAVAVGVFGMSGYAIAMVLVIQRAEPHRTGRDSALVAAGNFVGLAVGPPLAGAAVPYIGYVGIWLAVAASFMIAATVATIWALFDRRTHSRDRVPTPRQPR